MPTAVVTGGSGFLGSHVCDRLIKEGISVICIDNLLTGSIDNIAHLQGNPEFTFINHDVTDISVLLLMLTIFFTSLLQPVRSIISSFRLKPLKSVLLVH